MELSFLTVPLLLSSLQSYRKVQSCVLFHGAVSSDPTLRLKRRPPATQCPREPAGQALAGPATAVGVLPPPPLYTQAALALWIKDRTPATSGSFTALYSTEHGWGLSSGLAATAPWPRESSPTCWS